MPVINKSRLFFSRLENNNNNPIMIILPMAADNIVAIYPPIVKVPAVTIPFIAIITIATPRLAPEVIPKIEGPANGLSNAVCNIRPDTAKPAPASRAVRA